MATAELRPLRIGEILDASIKLFLRHAGTFFKIVLVVIAPVQVVSSLITASTAPEFLEIDPEGTDTEDFEVILGGQLVVVLLTMVTFLLTTAACFKAVSDAYLGARPDWRRSLRFAARHSHSLLWLFVVMGIALLLAFIALIIPGIWLSVAVSVAIPVLFVEGTKGVRALRRSIRLVRRRWWATAGAVSVGFLLASIVGGLLAGLLILGPYAVLGDEDVFVNSLATALSNTVASVLTTPFQAALVTLVYFDLRVRKEGFDLELLAERIGVAPDERRESPAWAPPTVTPEERAQAPYWPPPPGWKPAAPSDAPASADPASPPPRDE